MAGYVVADIAALKTVTTGADKMRFVVSRAAWYFCDFTSTDTGNDDWIVAPTTGNGRWYPVGLIFGTATPSGATAQPVHYARIASASGGNAIQAIYLNPGGGSVNWELIY